MSCDPSIITLLFITLWVGFLGVAWVSGLTILGKSIGTAIVMSIKESYEQEK